MAGLKFNLIIRLVHRVVNQLRISSGSGSVARIDWPGSQWYNYERRSRRKWC